MDRLEHLITTLTYLLDNKRKRHIVGGVMLSASLLFGGLALTVMTIKNEETNNNEQDFY